MPEIKEPDLSEKDLQNLKLDISKEAQSDLIEEKYRRRLNFFRILARYITLGFASVVIVIFGCRYLHLINGYEKVTKLYLSCKDWQVIVIYALSLAFTAGLIVSVLVVMVKLIKSKNKKKS